MGFVDVFARKSNPKRPENAFLGTKSFSKGPNHALEKVLTSETPGMHMMLLVLPTVSVYIRERKAIDEKSKIRTETETKKQKWETRCEIKETRETLSKKIQR